MKNILKKLVLSLLTLSVVVLSFGGTSVFAGENNLDDNFNPYSFPTDVELEMKNLSNEDIDDLFIIEASSDEKAQASVDLDDNYERLESKKSNRFFIGTREVTKQNTLKGEFME